MKIKHLTIITLAIFAFQSCKKDAKKEVTKEATKKEAPVKKKKKVKEQPFVYGVDISSYQGDEVDLINKHKDSLGFVICKASQGVFLTDPKFQQNWSKIKSDGFIRGAYHFYMSNNDPTDQANYFANVISSIEATDLPPIVDFESGGIDKSQSIDSVSTGLITFIHALEEKLNRKPMIYTDIPTADKYLNDPVFADYALWIAVYNGKSTPDLPSTWAKKGWTLWQRDATYKIVNFTNDSDVFNGDITRMKDFIKSYK